jgi:transcriptional regulator GlxA family with amidase domain
MSTNSLSIVVESEHLDRMYPQRELYLDPRIRKVVGLMCRNPHLRLSLSRLAGAIALSPSRFSHLFKAETGVSPAQFLKSIRLQRSRDLLGSTNLSVKEVAGCVGLGVSHLIREYRNTYGATPRQHRRIICFHVEQEAGSKLRATPAPRLLNAPKAARFVYE